MAAEADRAIGSLDAGQAVEDRMPVRRDVVEGAVAAPAVAAPQSGIAPVQALAHAGQPVAVGGLVVMVRIDRLAKFLSCQAAGVDHLAVGRLEVDAVDEVAVDRASAETRGLAE